MERGDVCTSTNREGAHTMSLARGACLTTGNITSHKDACAGNTISSLTGIILRETPTLHCIWCHFSLDAIKYFSVKNFPQNVFLDPTATYVLERYNKLTSH
jgi:hypothetical protein